MKNSPFIMKTELLIKRVITLECHKADSNRQVIRHVISQFRAGYFSWQKLDREYRKWFMRQCINAHKRR